MGRWSWGLHIALLTYMPLLVAVAGAPHSPTLWSSRRSSPRVCEFDTSGTNLNPGGVEGDSDDDFPAPKWSGRVSGMSHRRRRAPGVYQVSREGVTNCTAIVDSQCRCELDDVPGAQCVGVSALCRTFYSLGTPTEQLLRI